MDKKIVSRSDSPRTISMFDVSNTEKRPPLDIAKNNRFPLQHETVGGQDFYSVQDWLNGVSQTKQARVMWIQLQERLAEAGVELFDSIKQLPYRASNGAVYQMDFAHEKLIYQITQYMRAKTGIRDEVLSGLAEAGVFVGNIREDIKAKQEQAKLPAKDRRLLEAKIEQGFSEEDSIAFVQLANDSKAPRKDWTGVLKLAVRGAVYYGTITNDEYETLFGMTAAEITEATGFKPARNGMTRTGRAIVTAAECALEEEFGKRKDLTFAQAREITRQVCSDFRIPIRNVEARLGINLATGQKLLGGGK